MGAYDSLLEPPARRHPAPFGVLRVTGPDAIAFLQRLCSQDVAALQPGQVLPAAFLNPKGKLVGVARIARVDDGAWLEVQDDQIGVLAELLARYHFTEKLTLDVHDGWVCGEVVRGAPGDAGAVGAATALAPQGVALSLARRGLLSERHHAPAAYFEQAWPGAVLPALDDDRAEQLRIVAGEPRVGVDTEANTLALEADLDDHVATDKGCYTGQEIVARIHTYGHVNRKLCLLEIDALAPVELRTPLVETEAGDPVGRVMSSVALGPHRLALGYLPKDFWGPATELRVGGPEGPRAVVRPFGFGAT